MCQMNVLEAKTNLSKILSMLENREEQEVIIARNGRPVAKIVLLPQEKKPRRIGVAEGKFVCPEDIDEDNELIAQMFGV